MAPKTRGVSGARAEMKRKRTVRRPTREPTPESSTSSSSDDTPPPSTSVPQVDQFSSRIVTTGRKFNFDLFEREGFLIGAQLKELGFERICSLDCPTYPALVKEFYRNLCRGDNGLVSTVRGVRLNVSALILSNLLSLPLSGPSTFDPEDRSAALLRLLNKQFDGFVEVLASQLPLELRLLHNICSRILFPKTGRFDYVSERDIFVMDAVVSGKPINLPNMIIWYMADCGSKRKFSLPYGMILTEIFRSQGIEISDSEPKRELRHTDYYTLATIHRMGFIKKDGKWDRKTVSEERAEAPGPSYQHVSPELPDFDIPVPESAPAPAPAFVPMPSAAQPHSSASASTSSSDLLEQMRLMISAEFQSFEDRIDQKFKNIRDDLSALGERVASVEASISTSGSALGGDLQNIFTQLKSICGDADTYSECNAKLQGQMLAACEFVNEKLQDYVKLQSKDLQEIVKHLTRIIRTHF